MQFEDDKTILYHKDIDEDLQDDILDFIAPGFIPNKTYSKEEILKLIKLHRGPLIDEVTEFVKVYWNIQI